MTMKIDDRYIEGWERGAEAVVSFLSQEWPELMTDGDEDFPSVADQATEHYKDIVEFLKTC